MRNLEFYGMNMSQRIHSRDAKLLAESDNIGNATDRFVTQVWYPYRNWLQGLCFPSIYFIHKSRDWDITEILQKYWPYRDLNHGHFPLKGNPAPLTILLFFYIVCESGGKGFYNLHNYHWNSCKKSEPGPESQLNLTPWDISRWNRWNSERILSLYRYVNNYLKGSPEMLAQLE